MTTTDPDEVRRAMDLLRENGRAERESTELRRAEFFNGAPIPIPIRSGELRSSIPVPDPPEIVVPNGSRLELGTPDPSQVVNEIRRFGDITNAARDIEQAFVRLGEAAGLSAEAVNEFASTVGEMVLRHVHGDAALQAHIRVATELPRDQVQVPKETEPKKLADGTRHIDLE